MRYVYFFVLCLFSTFVVSHDASALTRDELTSHFGFSYDQFEDISRVQDKELPSAGDRLYVYLLTRGSSPNFNSSYTPRLSIEYTNLGSGITGVPIYPNKVIINADGERFTISNIRPDQVNSGLKENIFVGTHLNVVIDLDVDGNIMKLWRAMASAEKVAVRVQDDSMKYDFTLFDNNRTAISRTLAFYEGTQNGWAGYESSPALKTYAEEHPEYVPEKYNESPKIPQIADAVYELFYTSMSKWKQGDAVKVQGTHGNTFYYKTYYAKDHTMQTTEYSGGAGGGSSMEMHRFMTNKVDGLVEGFRMGMTQSEVKSFFGEDPLETDGNKWIYVADDGESGMIVYIIKLTFLKGELKEVEVAIDSYEDYPDKAEKMFFIDDSAPAIS